MGEMVKPPPPGEGFLLSDQFWPCGPVRLVYAFHGLSPLSIRTWLCCRKYPQAADSSLHTLPLLFLSYGVPEAAVGVLCIDDGKSCVLHANDSVHIFPFLPV